MRTPFSTRFIITKRPVLVVGAMSEWRSASNYRKRNFIVLITKYVPKTAYIVKVAFDKLGRANKTVSSDCCWISTSKEPRFKPDAATSICRQIMLHQMEEHNVYCFCISVFRCCTQRCARPGKTSSIHRYITSIIKLHKKLIIDFSDHIQAHYGAFLTASALFFR